MTQNQETKTNIIQFGILTLEDAIKKQYEVVNDIEQRKKKVTDFLLDQVANPSLDKLRKKTIRAYNKLGKDASKDLTEEASQKGKKIKYETKVKINQIIKIVEESKKNLILNKSSSPRQSITLLEKEKLRVIGEIESIKDDLTRNIKKLSILETRKLLSIKPFTEQPLFVNKNIEDIRKKFLSVLIILNKIYEEQLNDPKNELVRKMFVDLRKNYLNQLNNVTKNIRDLINSEKSFLHYFNGNYDPSKLQEFFKHFIKISEKLDYFIKSLEYTLTQIKRKQTDFSKDVRILNQKISEIETKVMEIEKSGQIQDKKLNEEHLNFIEEKNQKESEIKSLGNDLEILNKWIQLLKPLSMPLTVIEEDMISRYTEIYNNAREEYFEEKN